MGPTANAHKYKTFLPPRPGDGDLWISLLFLAAIPKRERGGGKESAMKGDFAITVLKNRSLPISHIIQATKAVHVAKS